MTDNAEDVIERVEVSDFAMDVWKCKLVRFAETLTILGIPLPEGKEEAHILADGKLEIKIRFPQGTIRMVVPTAHWRWKLPIDVRQNHREN